MNILKNKYSWLLGILICSISCEERLDNVEPPAFVPKLVVASFISPTDSVLNVSLQKNRPVFGELTNPPPIEAANVLLSDGTNSISLVKSSSGQFSVPTNQFPIINGKRYTLSVKTADGLQANAECDIPLFRDLNIRVDTFWVTEKNNNNGGSNYYRCRIKFTDFPGEKNYYRVIAQQISYSKGESQTNELYIDKQLFTDNGNDGKEFLTSTSLYSGFFQVIDSVLIKIHVLSTDYPYYKYHESLSQYSGGNDPFSEVVPVYSNINNGLGVFCGFTENVQTFRLE